MPYCTVGRLCSGSIGLRRNRLGCCRAFFGVSEPTLNFNTTEALNIASLWLDRPQIRRASLSSWFFVVVWIEICRARPSLYNCCLRLQRGAPFAFWMCSVFRVVSFVTSPVNYCSRSGGEGTPCARLFLFSFARPSGRGAKIEN